MRVALKIVLIEEKRLELVELTTSGLTSVRLAQRAQIVLSAAEGFQNQQIAEQLGTGRIPKGSRQQKQGGNGHLCYPVAEIAMP